MSDNFKNTLDILAGPFLNPQEVVDSLGVSEGEKVADFGCGVGRYTKELAKKVGTEGMVFALDVQDSLLETLARDAKQELGSMDNIILVHTDLEKENSTKIKDESLDMVLAANLYFLLKDKKTPTKEAYRILKKGGRFVLIDWVDSFFGVGPPEDMVFREQDAIELFESMGFTLSGKLPHSHHHYILIFTKL